LKEEQKGTYYANAKLIKSKFLKKTTKMKIHRVSIRSFPDYKHLLHENYVEYEHIFLPLHKLVSKILCHVFIVTFGFWVQHFQTGGLGEMVRHPGHHDRQVSPS